MTEADLTRLEQMKVEAEKPVNAGWWTAGESAGAIRRYKTALRVAAPQLLAAARENARLPAERDAVRAETLREVVQMLKEHAISVELSTLCFPDENVTRKWALEVSRELDKVWKKLEALMPQPPDKTPVAGEERKNG